MSLAVAAALALAVPVSAQQRAPGDAGLAPLTSAMRVAAPAISLTPMGGSAALAVRVIESTVAPSIAPLSAPMRQSQSVALMIVGGAGMIVGSLIDGDTGTIIMVGGGIMGLVGLFNYLR
ncbi:MAG: hypothetical protein Q8N53_14805 [Longimicrobiales bacterium]|nr:hypothetical protein [Longimicrobiales bacterium]